jgi:hypothetical protein
MTDITFTLIELIGRRHCHLIRHRPSYAHIMEPGRTLKMLRRDARVLHPQQLYD